MRRNFIVSCFGFLTKCLSGGSGCHKRIRKMVLMGCRKSVDPMPLTPAGIAGKPANVQEEVMKLALSKLLLLLVLIMSFYLLPAEYIPRATGYGISDPIIVNTIMGSNPDVSSETTINTDTMVCQ